MTLPAVLLVSGLLLAAASAAVGVAAAAVSQLDLTRWVSYKLRGAGAAAGVLENPGRVLATANALTTIGIICAAAAIPALLARTTPTVLGVFTIAVGIPVQTFPIDAHRRRSDDAANRVIDQCFEQNGRAGFVD